MALDRLIEAIKRTGNPSVAGLDPKLEYIPEYMVNAAFDEYGQTLEGAAEALLSFNKGIIDAICDIVPAVKPQAAYYEMYGWPGMRTLAKTIEYAKSKGMYVIIDGKRNDIGSTMEAYAAAHLGTARIGKNTIPAFGGDALTVNGYLGKDGIMPLIDVCRISDAGIFVLVKTSNPSSGDLQDKIIEGKPVYHHMGRLCEEWGRMLPGRYGYSGVGAVVGATWPEQLSELRAKLPHTFFLVPGYGAQGGGAADVKGAFDKDGIGGVVNSSRGILCAWKKEGCAPEDYAGAARREALRMKNDIIAVIG
ncbi:MAG: orotidine-5'-phosphate decarboxylase [Oscillospiraceae bacterium]|nr:orotidine-5'-phosphate decarboxylase [Oscillospiraceae bacterium]MDD4413733.1 orotidine-5'-phosphate decarboxylase [Oscillospiraceae bacterium]